jgi:glycosyltransferase involved in cell wall biosynthesis
VIKESMACNCPIVSVDVGDVIEVIDNTEGCYICSYDPKDVAEKIVLALNLVSRTKGRITIKHLNEEIITKKILNLYQEILTKKVV